MSGSPPPVLIAGSYPPIPVAGAPVALDEVRRAWAAGEEVTVVSPRLSAAHLAVPIAGVLAGRRLDNVRRHTGARKLVLVVEPGFPLTGGPARQLAAATALVRSMRRFEQVRLVRAGSGPGLSPRAWELLSSAAGDVSSVLGGPSASGVTPLGPPEVPLSQRPQQVAGGVARRVLGSRAPAVRARLGSVRRRLRL